jgi:ComF family protein
MGAPEILGEPGDGGEGGGRSAPTVGEGPAPAGTGLAGAASGAEAAPEQDGPWWRRAAAALEGSLDVLFPPSCVACRRPVEAAGAFRSLCARCAALVTLVKPPLCATCGYPYFGSMDENAGCEHCAALRPVYREGRTATLLRGPMRRLVHAIKYENAVHALGDVRAVVRANPHFRDFLAGAVLVPVPLHARKRRERGYNQAEWIARCFAAEARGAVVRSLLIRRIDTATQTRLDRAGRAANLKNAFALAEGAPVEPAARYVLVDDVFTTGATLDACAAALRAAGVTRVDVATLGHG